MQFKDIIYEVKSDYAHVTINRPKVLNAFTPVTLQELKTALDSAEKDKNVGVIVLSGAGDRAFCAGGDMNWESSKEFQDHEYCLLYTSPSPRDQRGSRLPACG